MKWIKKINGEVKWNAKRIFHENISLKNALNAVFSAKYNRVWNLNAKMTKTEMKIK